MFKQWLMAGCLAGSVFVMQVSAVHAADNTAAPASPETVVRKALDNLVPGLSIDSVKPAPMPGYYQVIAEGRLIYVSADGKYMMNGDIMDLTSKKNLSDAAWAAYRKGELAKLPEDARIIYAPAKPRYHVTVFTDVNCAYCRALHEHVADFNKVGIALEYVAWPREGVTTTAGRDTPTYSEMVSVWCAADRKQAFTLAKQGKAPHQTTCANPVKDEFDLGVRLGVDGTPTVIAEDGTVLGGYMTPEQMLSKLQGKGDLGG